MRTCWASPLAFASALFPLVNIEAYLVGRARGRPTSTSVWLLALVAGVGQMVGKLIWYYLGANALRWGWIRRKVEQPKNAAGWSSGAARTHDRPVVAGPWSWSRPPPGFPPFAIVVGARRSAADERCALFVGVGLARPLGCGFAGRARRRRVARRELMS